MAVAYDYPLLEVFLSLLEVFILIAWVMVVLGMLTDVFRSDDLSGWAKAGWVLLIIVVPIVGVLIYLVARGHKVSEHADATISRQDAAYMSYINRGR
jgi:Phospholipase_D-nuclease N-terminal